MTTSARMLVLIGTLIGVLTAPDAKSQAPDPLLDSFRNPPESAKPRVWWHWVDGNVSADGIREDLRWLNQIGVGGVQNFDAALRLPGVELPRLVERVAYLTPRWREMFRLAVNEAQQLGMEFTIAASPGWSESGGPWVRPAQGMKKLVWSETTVQGGTRFTGKLASPPHVTGPFQNIPFAPAAFAFAAKPSEYYADAIVVAFRQPREEGALAAVKPAITSSAGPVDGRLLSDGDLSQGVSVPYGEAATAWIQFAYSKPRRVQALTVSVARPVPLAPSDVASGAAVWLEASKDGRTFRRVIDVPRDGAPQQTLVFAATTARFFRLVLARPDKQPNDLESLLGLPSPQAQTAHQVLECVLHASPRVNRFEDKAGFSNRAIGADEDTLPADEAQAISQDTVIDLTSRLQPDGTLRWTVPAGRWVILRFGYSLTGRTNHPASEEGTGLEVDKLNREHVRNYFDSYLAEYEKTLGPRAIGKHGLGYMLTDSYEARSANWTDDILTQFKQLRGYDPTAWLPVLAGRVVANSASSDRFLWDFRHTLADLIADAHYGQLSTLLHEHGMGRYGESHESGRAFVGDGMQVKKSADVPMGALWASAPGAAPQDYNMDILESASVAHIYGQNLVAAESLTAFGNTFAFAPEALKPFADRELAMGLNRFVIHTSVHQPDERLGPGLTLGPFGQWFTRHETWAGQAAPWIKYLTRSAYLLQQGRFVADIAYLYGEDNNITNLFGSSPPPVPSGYSYDFVNADALINVLTVKNGMIVTPSGMQYRMLALDPSTQRMSLPVLRKIHELVQQGAVVVGARPTNTPSLSDDQTAFERIAADLWDAQGGQGRDANEDRVLTGALAENLRKQAIAPDFAFSSSGDDLRYVHRTWAGGDLYFVSNGSAEPQAGEASFRVTGRAPEIWRADTGETTPATYRIEGDRTIVPLKLQPYDALFVVFRIPTTERTRTTPELASSVVARLDGPWTLAFPAGYGAPAPASLAALSSWTDSSDPGIKYFSGTATYRTRLMIKGQWLTKGSRLRLDLGEVKNLAEVSVNGHSLGALWKHPFVIDISDAVHGGENQLEVKVTNLWPNRLIGDKQPGATRIAYSSYDPYRADSPLLPSGLLGPVSIEQIH